MEIPMTTDTLTATPRTARFTVAAVAVALIAVLMTSCAPASTPWTSDTPAGSLDRAYLDHTGTQLWVQGWASDRNTTNPLTVVVFVDWSVVPGGIIANQPRPDVKGTTGRGGQSGFDVTVTIRAHPDANVCVSAINVGPGDNALLGCKEAVRDPSPRTTTTTTPKPTTTTTTTTTAVPTHCAAAATAEVDWHDCDKHGIDLSGADIYGANLSGANLSGANLSGTRLYGVDLSGADLSGANLSGAWMPYADLSDAITDEANVTDATWSYTVCPDGVNTGDAGTCVGHGF
jgi:hypothetical protein